MTYTEILNHNGISYGIAEEQGQLMPVAIINEQPVPQGRQTTDRVAAIEASLAAEEDIRRLMR